MNPEELLLVGCQILDPVLVPRGFRFHLGTVGQGSGGHFATGEYLRERRGLELHFRGSLGLVSYRLGSVSASHQALMRVVCAPGQNEYPGFSDDPLDGFRHLRTDIERRGQVFLTGTDPELLDLLSPRTGSIRNGRRASPVCPDPA
jgi:hypothetical protein